MLMPAIGAWGGRNSPGVVDLIYSWGRHWLISMG